MTLNVINENTYRLGSKKNLHLISRLIDHAVGSLPGTVNLVLCDDKVIRKLNRDYRKKNKVTDVLSFAYFDGATKPDELLGEVFISIPQTKRQACLSGRQAEKEHSGAEMELYKLCIHGLLHLRGYDHEEDEDFRVMKLLEDKIVKRFMESKKI